MTRDGGWAGLLEPGEEILWQGQPTEGVDWRGLTAPLSLFGMVFTLFSLGWIWFAAALIGGSDAPGILMVFPLFGLPFLAVGLYLAVGRLWVDALRRRGTWYTLTDRQAFMAEEALGRKTLRSWPIAEMSEVELIDGVPGDVLFGSETRARPRRAPAPQRSRRRRVTGTASRIGFFRIAEARKVWRLLRAQRTAILAAARAPEPEGTT